MTARLKPVLLLAALASGCLDPLAEDEVPLRDTLPPGTEPADVPTVSEAFPDIAAQIAEHDGVDGTLVPRLSGFVEEARVWYWDFGPAPDFAAPLWLLVDGENPDGSPSPVDHPDVWDVAPGDPTYSPFWAIFTVQVTPEWRGEQFTSLRAINDAVRLGLLEEPRPLVIDGETLYANCPVVAEDVRVELGGGVDPLSPCEPPAGPHCPKWAYFRGARVAYFDTSPGTRLRPHIDSKMLKANVYRLRRESEALPISEPLRGVDITGDGDAVDTNDVFQVGLNEPADGPQRYSPLSRVVDVIVASDYSSIDLTGVETVADYMSEADMFDRSGFRVEPIVGAIRGFEQTDVYLNLPLQSAAGGW